MHAHTHKHIHAAAYNLRKYCRTFCLFSPQCLHRTKWPRRIFLLQGRGIFYLQVSQHLPVPLSLWQQNKYMHACIYSIHVLIRTWQLQWRSTRWGLVQSTCTYGLTCGSNRREAIPPPPKEWGRTKLRALTPGSSYLMDGSHTKGKGIESRCIVTSGNRAGKRCLSVEHMGDLLPELRQLLHSDTEEGAKELSHWTRLP